MKIDPKDLAMIAATLSAGHPEKTEAELAVMARSLFLACEQRIADDLAASEHQQKDAELREDAERREMFSTTVPFGEHLTMLMPKIKDRADREARYRHFLEYKKVEDLQMAIEKWRSEGIPTYFANCVKAAFPNWFKEQTANQRSKAGRKGGQVKNSNKGS
jgi:hypothetical protein